MTYKLGGPQENCLREKKEQKSVANEARGAAAHVLKGSKTTAYNAKKRSGATGCRRRGTEEKIPNKKTHRETQKKLEKGCYTKGRGQFRHRSRGKKDEAKKRLAIENLVRRETKENQKTGKREVKH